MTYNEVGGGTPALVHGAVAVAVAGLAWCPSRRRDGFRVHSICNNYCNRYVGLSGRLRLRLHLHSALHPHLSPIRSLISTLLELHRH